MADELSRGLTDELQKRILRSGEWEVVGIVGRGGVPTVVRNWCLELFGTPNPILVVIQQTPAQPPSADASDPHAPDPGKPPTRGGASS